MMKARPERICLTTKVSGIPTPSWAKSLASTATAPFPKAATKINAYVFTEFKPEIEFRSGYKVMPIKKVTSNI